MAVPAIFISHSHFDNDFCERLYQWLVDTLSADVFYDTQRLHGGDDWMDRIQHELEHRPLFILVLSRNSIEATWVRVETKLAIDLTFSAHSHRIIPIVIDSSLTRADINKLSSFLHIFQRIDLSLTSSENNWQNLADVVRGVVSDRSSDAIAIAQISQIEKAARDAMMVHEELKAGRFQEVIFYATHALQDPANAEDATIWSDLARAHNELDDPDQAMTALERSLELNEFVGENWDLKAQWLARRTPPAIDEAQKSWDQALYHTRSPELRESYLRNEVQVLLKAKNWKEVLQVCRRGLQFVPDSPDWHSWQNQANQALKQEASAQEVQLQTAREQHQLQVLESRGLPTTRGKGRIISIANQKGRTGKTTTAINLAAYLAAVGRKVLLVDMSPNAEASTSLGVAPNGDYSLRDLLLFNQITLADILAPSTRPNLTIVPATGNLYEAEIELARLSGGEYNLKCVLDTVRSRFDVIIIDCPSSLGMLTINAFTASERIMIPVLCDYLPLEGLSALLNVVKLVRAKWNPTLEILGVVLTMFDPRGKLGIEIAREMKSNFPKEVFQTVIGRNIRLSEAPNYGKSILEYDPSSPGALAYRALAEEVIARGGA